MFVVGGRVDEAPARSRWERHRRPRGEIDGSVALDVDRDPAAESDEEDELAVVAERGRSRC